MRKKSKNVVLFVVLVLSILTLLGLLFVLGKKPDSPADNTQTAEEKKEEYYCPTVTTKRVVAAYGTEILPEMFIESVESIYDVSYSYEKKPDLETYGVQEVIVLVTDAIGNSSAVKAKLNILNLKDRVELNLGEEVPAAETFLVKAGSTISYVTNISTIDTQVAKEYTVYFLVDGDYVSTVLSVNDYAAPEVVTRDVETWLNRPVEITEFIVSANDATVVEYTYETEPDWSIPGEQQLTILATDENSNQTVCNVVLTLQTDTKAPVVSASNLDVIVGGNVSYRNAVSYYDNASSVEEMSLTIDNSNVNLDQVGTYEVEYTVTDFAGNSTSVVALVNVLEEVPVWNDEELLLERATEILGEILAEGMSDYEKAEAIFNWVNSNIRFINFSEKDNFARGAYEGMVLQQGDCFVYAATSKYLLTLAQIQNIDIKKSSTDPAHYWNLVYIEDGWYHFDACPTREGKKLFLYTDTELEAFSASRGNSHVYDKSLYPEIK